MKAEEVIEEEVGNLPTLYSVDLLNMDTCRNELLLEDIKEYGRKILQKICLTFRMKQCRIVRASRYEVSQAWLAQLVEQRTENPRVSGSIPEPGILSEKTEWGISSVGRALDF